MQVIVCEDESKVKQLLKLNSTYLTHITTLVYINEISSETTTALQRMNWIVISYSELEVN